MSLWIPKNVPMNTHRMSLWILTECPYEYSQNVPMNTHRMSLWIISCMSLWMMNTHRMIVDVPDEAGEHSLFTHQSSHIVWWCVSVNVQLTLTQCLLGSSRLKISGDRAWLPANSWQIFHLISLHFASLASLVIGSFLLSLNFFFKHLFIRNRRIERSKWLRKMPI